jgi:hypothetical protein
MADFLELDLSDGLETSAAESVQRIANLEERIGKFINFMNYRPSKRRYLIEEGGAETTSDFPILFGTVLDRQLYAKYKLQNPAWRSYVRTGTQRDFRANNIIGVFGLQGALSKVPELSEYKAGALTEGRVANQVFKYGKVFPISWEAIINDDLGAFSDVAERLANAALQTEYREATKLFAAASGPSTAVFGTAITAIDGVVVNNKGTTALSATSLFDTTVLMAQQLDVDGNPIMVDGYTLVVPPQKQRAALEAVSPAALIAVGLSSTSAKERQTSMNVTASLNIDIVVNPFLPIIDTTTGTTAWYLFAKLSNGAAIQMNFLTGRESPEIVMKASDKVAIGGGSVSPMEGSFSQDSMLWRVRHILGGNTIDVRMAYAQAATT